MIFRKITSGLRDFKKDFYRRNMQSIGYACIAIVILWLIHFFYLINFNPKNSYHTSFSASLLEDILFFFSLGILVFKYSLKDGSDFNLRNRVSILANNRNIDDSVVEYLLDRITPILAYNKSANIDITIDALSDNKEFIRVYSNIQNVIVNMCYNDIFTLPKTDFTIQGDHMVGEDYGYIEYVGIKNLTSGGSIPQEPVKKDKGVTPIKISPRIFPINNFIIPKNGEAESKMSWAVWEPLNVDKSVKENWYYFGNQRFTNKVTFDIQNRIEGLDLFVDVRFNKKDEDEKLELLSHQKLDNTGITVPFESRLFPGDRFEIIFYTD